MFIGVTFSYNLSSGLLRAIGNSFMSLVFLVIASILNIFLDIYFITSLKMGIGGAAIATVIAQAISVILSIIYIYVKEPILIPRKKHFRFDKKLYKETAWTGTFYGIYDCNCTYGNAYFTVCDKWVWILDYRWAYFGKKTYGILQHSANYNSTRTCNFRFPK